MVPPKGVLDLKPRNTKKGIKNLQNLMAEICEICYVAWSFTKFVQAIKNLLHNLMAEICEIWYVAWSFTKFVQNGPIPGDPGFASKIYLKIFFSRLNCLKFCM